MLGGGGAHLCSVGTKANENLTHRVCVLADTRGQVAPSRVVVDACPDVRSARTHVPADGAQVRRAAPLEDPVPPGGTVARWEFPRRACDARDGPPAVARRNGWETAGVVEPFPRTIGTARGRDLVAQVGHVHGHRRNGRRNAEQRRPEIQRDRRLSGGLETGGARN